MTLSFWLIWRYSNLSFRALGPGMQFQHKLHIVYLVNDILHHCQRKGAQDLKKSLEDIIVPLFFCTQIGESPENLQKITKVLGISELSLETQGQGDIQQAKVMRTKQTFCSHCLCLFDFLLIYQSAQGFRGCPEWACSKLFLLRHFLLGFYFQLSCLTLSYKPLRT